MIFTRSTTQLPIPPFFGKAEDIQAHEDAWRLIDYLLEAGGRIENGMIDVYQSISLVEPAFQPRLQALLRYGGERDLFRWTEWDIWLV